jgi:hypothetical protein
MPAERSAPPSEKSLTEAIGQTAGVLASTISEAVARATEIGSRSAGNLASQGLRSAGTPPTLPRWMESILTQYRESLGGLALMLPRIAHRLDRDLRPQAGERLLFRARADTPEIEPEAAEKNLHKVVKIWEDSKTSTGEPVRAFFSQATAELVQKRGAELDMSYQSIDTALMTLLKVFRDDRRKDLPRLLDELKYAVRENRREGIALVRQHLQWLFDDKLGDLSKAFDLHDALSDDLGERCLDTIIHAIPIFGGAEAEGKNPFLPPKGGWSSNPWTNDLRACFQANGHPLEGAVSVLRSGGTELSSEFTVLDHQQDLVFKVRRGVRAVTSSKRRVFYDLEVYGPFAGKRYEVAGEAIRLPARISSARGGMALWAVDRRRLQEHLDSLGGNVPMSAWDIGANRALVGLFVMQYRESDLGPYLELGFGCLGVPASNPLAVGFVPLGPMPVSRQDAQRPGKHIWGFPKEVIRNDLWSVRHTMTRSEWNVVLDENQGTALRLTLPRGGSSSSENVPMSSYTLRFGQWHQSVFMRNGQGESLRFGGKDVSLSVTGDKWDQAGNSIPDLLYQFGLLRAYTAPDGTRGAVMAVTPSYTTWTENVSGELLPPWVVPTLPVIEER